MIKAVLDTNVFVSALFWKGAPHAVVRQSISGAFVTVISPAIIAELQETLAVKFGLPPEDIREYLRIIAIHAAFVEPKAEPRVVASDRSDDKIIACALAGDAHCIVTGDKHLLSLKEFSGIRIVTPSTFLRVLKT
jgi:putative PIN family toxin of toxin-antitoxin system